MISYFTSLWYLRNHCRRASQPSFIVPSWDDSSLRLGLAHAGLFFRPSQLAGRF